MKEEKVHERDREFLARLKGYSDEELEEVFEAIDRKQFPERYLALMEELAERGHFSAGMTDAEVESRRHGSAARELWRFKAGCLLIGIGVLVVLWVLMIVGQAIWGMGV